MSDSGDLQIIEIGSQLNLNISIDDTYCLTCPTSGEKTIYMEDKQILAYKSIV